MTDSKALSRNSLKRSTPYMNDAANSQYEANLADAYPVIEWIKRTGASIDKTLAAWKDGKLAELPVGRAWDVIRIPTFEGWEVVRQLRTLRVALGPVLHTQLGVEVLVPVGSAEDWDVPGSTVLVVGDTIDVPHPAVVPPHTQNARYGRRSRPGSFWRRCAVGCGRSDLCGSSSTSRRRRAGSSRASHIS